MQELNSLKKILDAIKNKDINYGINKEYCFVSDEDGELIFLKRNDAKSEHQRELDKHHETRHNWPENHYDGEVLWKHYTGEGRGLVITDMFLQALDIECAG
jgi:hypothetical protein